MKINEDKLMILDKTVFNSQELKEKIKFRLEHNYVDVNIDDKDIDRILSLIDTFDESGISTIFKILYSDLYFNYSALDLNYSTYAPDMNSLDYLVIKTFIDFIFKKSKDFSMSEMNPFLNALYMLYIDEDVEEMYPGSVLTLRRVVKDYLKRSINPMSMDIMVRMNVTRFNIKINTPVSNIVPSNLKNDIIGSIINENIYDFDPRFALKVVNPIMNTIGDVFSGLIYNMYYGIENKMDNVFGCSLYVKGDE